MPFVAASIVLPFTLLSLLLQQSTLTSHLYFPVLSLSPFELLRVDIVTSVLTL